MDSLEAITESYRPERDHQRAAAITAAAKATTLTGLDLCRVGAAGWRALLDTSERATSVESIDPATIAAAALMLRPVLWAHRRPALDGHTRRMDATSVLRGCQRHGAVSR